MISKRYLITSLLAAGIIFGAITVYGQALPSQSEATLEGFGLKEGQLIQAEDANISQLNDPDIYIINEWLYRRLFLNPVIFSFYGHLGGFQNVKKVHPVVRDIFETSVFVRNCETGDEKVYAIEVTGEDTGTLHWINVSGTSAVSQDGEFFRKIFCINNNEFNWYARGTDYTAVRQAKINDRYPRQTMATPTPAPAVYIPLNSKTWKKTDNTKYGFSFSYPPAWKAVKYSDEAMSLNDIESTFFELLVSVNPNTDKKTLIDYWHDASAAKTETSVSYPVSGRTGLKIIGPYGSTLLVDLNGSILLFTTQTDMGILNFDSIISTLQFAQ